MTEFENLRQSYEAAIQFGIEAKMDCQQVKQGNELLHKFCEQLVENSNYGELEKEHMKCELEILKKVLTGEIESRCISK